MPGLSGVEVLRKVRETRNQMSLPIIMVTSEDKTEEIGGEDEIVWRQ